MILTALFAAIIIIMALTPLGYLKIGLLEITLIPIPVAISAIVLGPAIGAGMGLVFGVTSFLQCVLGLSPFGAALMGMNLAFTIVLCIVPRVLDGWLTGLIFKALSKIDKTKWLSLIAAGFCGAALNTLFFMSGLYLLFAKNPSFISTYGSYTFISIFAAMAGVNGLVEILACTIVAPPVSKALLHYQNKTKIKKEA